MIFKFSPVDRHMTVYFYESETKEFASSESICIPANTGIPADSTLFRPPVEIEGFVRIFDPDTHTWDYIIDMRGTKLWKMEDGSPAIMGSIGKIPEGYTVKEPTGSFQTWVNGEWILDEFALKRHHVSEAKNIIASGIEYVRERMEVLKYGEDLGALNDSEKEEYNALKLFRFKLSRIDPEDAPHIEWPEIST